jgi:hypothetical protein
MLACMRVANHLQSSTRCAWLLRCSRHSLGNASSIQWSSELTRLQALYARVQGTPSLEELKLQYYRLYIQYYQQEHNYLEICRCYRAIYDTPSILADPAQWQPVRITCYSASTAAEHCVSIKLY